MQWKIRCQKLCESEVFGAKDFQGFPSFYQYVCLGEDRKNQYIRKREWFFEPLEKYRSKPTSFLSLLCQTVHVIVGLLLLLLGTC